MGYYIGLALMEDKIKLVNVRKKGAHWHLERKLSIDLSKPFYLTEAFKAHTEFKIQLEHILSRKKFKGNKMGILVPSDTVIRRTIKVPHFIKPQIHAYIETNKAQFLPLKEDKMTIDYEKCNVQFDTSYERYHITGIDHTFLAPFTIWLEDLGFHTQRITTIGDTLPYVLNALKRKGHYCLVCIEKNMWHVIFYEEGQCIYEHRIRTSVEDPKNDAWEMFKIIQFMHPYEQGTEVKEILYLQETDAYKVVQSNVVIEELSQLLNQKIEDIVSSKTLNDIGLIGLIYQMSEGGKRCESCTNAL